MLNLVFENVFAPERPLVWHLPTHGLISHSTLPSCTLSYCCHRLDLNQLPFSDDLIHSGHLVTHLQEAFILLFLKPACLSSACGVLVCAAPPLLGHQAMMAKATATSRFNLTANLRHLSITAQRLLLAVILPSLMDDLICHWPIALSLHTFALLR